MGTQHPHLTEGQLKNGPEESFPTALPCLHTSPSTEAEAGVAAHVLSVELQAMSITVVPQCLHHKFISNDLKLFLTE